MPKYYTLFLISLIGILASEEKHKDQTILLWYPIPLRLHLKPKDTNKTVELLKDDNKTDGIFYPSQYLPRYNQISERFIFGENEAQYSFNGSNNDKFDDSLETESLNTSHVDDDLLSNGDDTLTLEITQDHQNLGKNRNNSKELTSDVGKNKNTTNTEHVNTITLKITQDKQNLSKNNNIIKVLTKNDGKSKNTSKTDNFPKNNNNITTQNQDNNKIPTPSTYNIVVLESNLDSILEQAQNQSLNTSEDTKLSPPKTDANNTDFDEEINNRLSLKDIGLQKILSTLINSILRLNKQNAGVIELQKRNAKITQQEIANKIGQMIEENDTVDVALDESVPTEKTCEAFDVLLKRLLTTSIESNKKIFIDESET